MLITIAFTALILDMDGLMLDTEVLYRRAWQDAALALGCHLSDAMYAELIGLGRVESEAQMSRWFAHPFQSTISRLIGSIGGRWIRA